MNQLIIQQASKLIGMKEIPGEDQNNPDILELARELNLMWIKNDEVPWCAVGLNAVLKRCGLSYKSTARALDMLDYGISIEIPEPGDICVFERIGGGHNAFYLGHHATLKNKIWIMGGNQGNEWKIALYSTDNLKAYRRATETTQLIIPDPILKTGSVGQQVLYLQQCLLWAGYYKMKCDGVYGDGTASSVISFQTKNGLQANGVYDDKMKEKLFSLMNE